MLRNIHLHGSLKDYSVKPIQLDATYVSHVFSGLKSAYPSIEPVLRNSEYYIVAVDGENLKSITSENIMMPLGDYSDVHIIPKADGEGYEAAAYVYAALESYGVYVAAAAAAVAFIAVTYAIAMVAAALMPSPGIDGSESADNQPSFIFNGAVNVVEEGYPVPLVYGEVLTGSVVISVDYQNEDITVDYQSQSE